jgi:glutaredoxin-related protein
MYYIKGIMLKNCSYSDAALKLLKTHNIEHNITTINYNNVNNYITNQIDTFPQLYLKKKNEVGNLLLGGYDDLKKFIETFKNKKYSEENVEKFMKEYNWSKKACLRLIELLL